VPPIQCVTTFRYVSQFFQVSVCYADIEEADAQNYRPISNLFVVSKLLESLVASKLLSYLNCNNLLPENQLAYRANHSTETATMMIVSDIPMAFDDGDIADHTLLDCSVAFDTMDHEILLCKLS